MNAKTLIAVVALSISAGSAFAGQYAFTEPSVAMTSTMTRADVTGQLQEAQAAGTIVSPQLYGKQMPIAKSNLTRNEVRAAAIANARQPMGDRINEGLIGG